MTPETLKAWRARLSLGEAGMAAYLGVPVTTYRKWENGTRKPDAAPLRLFEVLQLLETAHKSTHLTLMSEAMSAENKPLKARKPRADTQTPATPEKRPSGPGWAGDPSTQDYSSTVEPLPWIHGLPAWMMGGV